MDIRRCSPSCAHVLFVASASSPQSAPCARVDGGAASSSAPDSTILPPASNVATSPHRSSARPRKPSVPPPGSAQTARPPPRHTSPAPTAALSSAASTLVRGSNAVPRCGASDRPLLLPDSASTIASPVGNSPPSAGSLPRSGVAYFESAQELPLCPTPSCSSPSAPIESPFGDPFKGTFLSRTKGDTITEVQQHWSEASDESKDKRSILERVKTWKDLHPGESIVLKVAKERLHYDCKEPGTYEFLAYYFPPAMTPSDRKALSQTGIDFPHSQLTTAPVPFVKNP
jgi:hypothetical protein